MEYHSGTCLCMNLDVWTLTTVNTGIRGGFWGSAAEAELEWNSRMGLKIGIRVTKIGSFFFRSRNCSFWHAPLCASWCVNTQLTQGFEAVCLRSRSSEWNSRSGITSYWALPCAQSSCYCILSHDNDDSDLMILSSAKLCQNGAENIFQNSTLCGAVQYIRVEPHLCIEYDAAVDLLWKLGQKREHNSE